MSLCVYVFVSVCACVFVCANYLYILRGKREEEKNHPRIVTDIFSEHIETQIHRNNCTHMRVQIFTHKNKRLGKINIYHETNICLIAHIYFYCFEYHRET